MSPARIAENNEEDRPQTSIDSRVLEEAELLSDTWANKRGMRFYRLDSKINEEHGDVYAITEYTRSIDEETGDVVEEEVFAQIGEFGFEYSRGRSHTLERTLHEYLSEDNPSLWNEVTVEHILDEFVTYIETRLPNYVDASESADFTETGTPNSLSLAIDTDFEADKLARDSGTSFNQTEWEIFLHALERESTLIDSLSGVGYTHETGTSSWEPDAAYTVTNPTLSPVSEWRLRAIEKIHCGVYDMRQSLAYVSALDAHTDHSQADMAKILDRDDSVISRQMQDVRDLRERIKWECEQ